MPVQKIFTCEVGACTEKVTDDLNVSIPDYWAKIYLHKSIEVNAYRGGSARGVKAHSLYVLCCRKCLNSLAETIKEFTKPLGVKWKECDPLGSADE